MTASILVCEDEALVARDIEYSLVRLGYDVVGVAADADRALELIEQATPDLVLMDISLSGEVNGIELASLIWERHGIPAIYLTGYSDEETIARAKTTLPLSYLLKPFVEQELKTAIEVGLYRHQEQRQAIDALKDQVDRFTEAEPEDTAARLERDFLATERISSSLRIGANVAARLRPDAEACASLLERVSADESLSAEAKAALRRAAVHQARLCDMTARLVRCADVERPAMKLFSLEKLIEEAVAEVQQRTASELNLVRCYGEQSLDVEVDRAAFRYALLCVLQNAIDASSRAPMIGVGTLLVFEELPERYNASSLPGWYAVARIEDMGTGMPPEIFERMFEPSFSGAAVRNGPRGDDSRQHATSPAGIGLCEVYSIMHQHGGWISVFSKVGVGTRVELYLPLGKRRSDRKKERGTIN